MLNFKSYNNISDYFLTISFYIIISFKVETFENDFFYLIRVVPRRNLLTLCKPDDLLALAYFIIQIFWRRKSYIIQKLE